MQFAAARSTALARYTLYRRSPFNREPNIGSHTGERMGLRMRVHEREPIGAALRRFKKLIERSGMKRELRAHEYYEKPCEARNRKKAQRKRAIKKAALGLPPKKERTY